MTKAWLTFIKERFPLGVYGILSLGFSVSASFFNREGAALPIFLSTVGIFLFFFTLRVMDEYKDFHKDLVAHPKRPLPRGLISYTHARTAIYVLIGTMNVYAFSMIIFLDEIVGLFYLSITLYLFLMFKEFFIGVRLSRTPLFYAFTHQIILFLLVFFSLSFFGSLSDRFSQKLLYAAMIFFAFFAYEIARKLDPAAPEILGTYWRICGKRKTTFTLMLLITASACCAVNLFHSYYFLPPSFLVLASFMVFLKTPFRYKWVEVTASFSLLFHIWSMSFARLL